MNHSIMSARSVDSDGVINMKWKWSLQEIEQDKDVNVFSCFSCGGGSTMGYKKAGFHVIGNVELDPKINEIYKKNHKPQHNFCMDLREFNALPEVPDDLMNLDILDGSPPCSTFSMAGSREEAWGKEKQFREGQKKQRLDDLFFVFLETVERLRPKIVVAENVKGLIAGNARGYVNEIIKRFKEIGYKCQIFLLNSAYMDVPQTRERVFFIANRCDFPKLKLSFKEKPITFGEVRSELGEPITSASALELLKHIKPTDKDFGSVSERIKGKRNSFGVKIIHDNWVCGTITAGNLNIRYCDKMKFSKDDIVSCSTFPYDYDFGDQDPQYVCGMSVPPNMMAHIAEEIYKQWLA